MTQPVSADIMPRNIDRRVEVLFPVEDPDLRQEIVDDILSVYLMDTARGHELQADGTYLRLRDEPAEGGRAI